MTPTISAYDLARFETDFRAAVAEIITHLDPADEASVDELLSIFERRGLVGEL